MRTTSYIILALLLAGPTGVGQDNKERGTNASANPGSKTVVTVDAPPTSFRKVGQAEVSYFSESDTTEVRSEFKGYRGPGQFANLWFVITAKGKRVVQPKLVSVGMAFFGDKVTVESVRDFVLEVEGKPVQFDDLTSSGVGYDYNSKNSFKAMKGTMGFAEFERIVKSQAVKIHVGDIVLELSKSNRDALRDMLKAVEPASSQ
jgi:hypothetical protein